MKKRLTILLLALLVMGCGKNLQAAQPKEKVRQWAEQILLNAEYGDKNNVCRRWVRTPRLSVFGASSVENKVVTEVVTHLNETLANTSIKKLMVVKPHDTSADLCIYFAPVKEFPALAKKHGFRYEPGNVGYFWTFWNTRYEIYKAFVLIAPDNLPGKYLRHFVLEEITQSLGLSNDSPLFPDSIFYANKKNGGKAQELSSLDKKLLVLFYQHVKPGTKTEALRATLKKHWPSE